MYAEDDYLALSGIQHFAFCRRQWALIHLEQQWSDSLLTVQGDLLHGRAHDEGLRERRGDRLIVRGLDVRSPSLGLAGKCDVVEFLRDDGGVPLFGEEGLWRPLPVEYKRGKAKPHDADRLQLCAQAICLEEMLACDIAEGCLYYGQTRNRERVTLGSEMREKARSAAGEMHRIYASGHTPSARRFAGCRSCSLRDLCVPETGERETVRAYLARRMGEGE